MGAEQVQVHGRRLTRLLALALVAVTLAAGAERVSRRRSGMVATASEAATEAGAQMLSAGGNAIDAAAAAAFAVMVVDPANTSLAGRAQILVALKDGRLVSIDGATQQPAGVVPRKERGEVRRGHLIVPVPGAPAAIEEMLRKYGRKSMADVLGPAIALAEKGFAVPPRLARLWSITAPTLRQDDGAAHNFLKPDGAPYQTGEIFKQPHLAAVLKRLAAAGSTEPFYKGEIAAAMAHDIEAHGGPLRASDLAAYRTGPGNMVRTQYRGHEVVCAGAREWGNTLKLMLEELGQTTIDARTSPAAVAEATTNAIRQAVAKRPRPAGDAAPHDTTHISTMDGEGNAVSLTTSIGVPFGARVASPDLGFLYAHSYRMDSNPAAGERDLTEMTPSMVLDGGKPFLVLGAAGSDRIPAAVLQVISNVVDRKMPIDQAVGAPRVFPIGNRLRLQDGTPPEVRRAMEAAGFEVELVEPGAISHFGIVQAIWRDPASGVMTGVADPAGDGSAAGPRRPRR